VIIAPPFCVCSFPAIPVLPENGTLPAVYFKSSARIRRQKS